MRVSPIRSLFCLLLLVFVCVSEIGCEQWGGGVLCCELENSFKLFHVLRGAPECTREPQSGPRQKWGVSLLCIEILDGETALLF